MALVFRALHKAKSKDALNEEWLLLENTGANPISAVGCALTVARNASERPHPIGTLDPGFVLQPSEKMRLVTGTPSKKAQGEPPAEDKGIKNYHLFLREPILVQKGLVLRLSLRQLELAKATFNPDGKDGL
jgi:hypothetical protein